jgi:hypothetical protein
MNILESALGVKKEVRPAESFRFSFSDIHYVMGNLGHFYLKEN